MSRTSSTPWRERLWLWLPPLIFFAVNLVAIVIYQFSGLAASVDLMAARITAAQSSEATLAADRDLLTEKVERAEATRDAVRTLYEERLSSQRIRLTRMITELRQLAAQTGLTPDNVSYPEEDIEEYGLVKKSFVFTVSGSYQNLRSFLNALELSESFITLERISLSDVAGSARGSLQISLSLSTLFEAEAEAADARAEGAS